MADGGYVQMNPAGLIDLGLLDFSKYGPTAADPSVFTDPRLAAVQAPAAVDARQNLYDALQAALGMQQEIPDAGPSYDAARAQRMAALQDDLGLLDKSTSAAAAQIAAQRARPMNFGSGPLNEQGNALFGRAYDFAEGSLTQGRLAAEAKLRAQANAPLDEILSGNYRASHQGQIQQALDLPNQALTASGQFNDVGMNNQRTSLAVALEEAANRRAEMGAQQQQQLARFGESGTDNRFNAQLQQGDQQFRAGLINSNAQQAVTEDGLAKRQFYQAKFQDQLENNKWFRELPLETQKLIAQVGVANMQDATTQRGNDLTFLSNQQQNATTLQGKNLEIGADKAANTVAFERQQVLNTQNAGLEKDKAELLQKMKLDPQDPQNIYYAAQVRQIDSTIDQNKKENERLTAQTAKLEAEAAANGGVPLTAKQKTDREADTAALQTVSPFVGSWTATAGSTTPTFVPGTWKPVAVDTTKTPDAATYAPIIKDAVLTLAAQTLQGKITSGQANQWISNYATIQAGALYDGTKPEDAALRKTAAAQLGSSLRQDYAVASGATLKTKEAKQALLETYQAAVSADLKARTDTFVTNVRTGAARFSGKK